MIDIHAHILPNIDDGPLTMEEAVIMAELAVADGITGICCTPHTLNGQFMTDAETVLRGCARLRERLSEKNIPLQLYPGAEIHITDATLQAILSEDALTLNNTGRYVLLESPPLELPLGFAELIYRLEDEGITPILAHPERIMSLLAAPDMLFPLVEEGLLCQITAMSITGEFGLRVRKTAQTMICCGLAHCIASDSHAETGRCPKLSEAMEQTAAWLGSLKSAEKLCIDWPAAVIAGETIDAPPPRRLDRIGFGEKIKRIFFG